MRSAGEETDRSTFTLTTLYRMLDDTYTDLYTCKEPHGDPGQSTRNAALDPPLRADHLAVHGAAPEPGSVHAADDARPRDLGGDLRLLDRAAEHRLARVAALRRRACRPLRPPAGAGRHRAAVRRGALADDRLEEHPGRAGARGLPDRDRHRRRRLRRPDRHDLARHAAREAQPDGGPGGGGGLARHDGDRAARRIADRRLRLAGGDGGVRGDRWIHGDTFAADQGTTGFGR